MKKFKAYFKMMITAVICLAMSLIPGKKKGQAGEAAGQGQADAGTGRNKNAFLGTNAGLQGMSVVELAGVGKNAADDRQKVSSDMQRFRQSMLQRHVVVPTVGPGDWGAGDYSMRKERTEPESGDGLTGRIYGEEPDFMENVLQGSRADRFYCAENVCKGRTFRDVKNKIIIFPVRGNDEYRSSREWNPCGKGYFPQEDSG